MIPMVNLKAQYAEIKEEIEQGLAETIEKCSFILGAQGMAFEKEAADYLGVKHAIGVASGTDALHLALRAYGIGENDEVITTAFTFIATAEAIKYVGAKPIFVDINPKTFNISPEEIEKAITPKTKAVLPVHLFGQPADLIRIKEICDKYQLKLIEDCCQSFGASIQGKQTGVFGEAGAFSFFPSKNLGAFGDGGLVITNDDNAANIIKKLRNHGSDIRYYHDMIGYNSRLDEMQAVVLRAKLKRINQYNQARYKVAQRYSELLSDSPVQTPFEDNIGVHVYHQYTLLCEQRDLLLKKLQENNISCAIYYPVPLHQQNVFKQECNNVNLPETEKVAKTCISLPICPFLTDTEIGLITDTIKSFFK